MVSPDLINAVLQQAVRVATHSWEYGTVAEALMEWYDPAISIWNNPFPGGQVPTLNVEDVDALTYIKPHIRTDNITLVDGAGKHTPDPRLKAQASDYMHRVRRRSSRRGHSRSPHR